MQKIAGSTTNNANLRGIMLKDQYVISQNFQIHRKKFQAIKNRKPIRQVLPPKPKKITSQPSLNSYYKPFLNISSKLINLKYFYSPTIPTSSLRIFNENRQIADRLQRIHLKKPRIDHPHKQISKPKYNQTLRERRLQQENMTIAKRILQTKSIDIDVPRLQRDYMTSQSYKRLRSIPNAVSKFRTLTSSQKQRKIRIGSGSIRVQLKIMTIKFHCFFPQSDDQFILMIKAGEKRHDLQIQTIPELMEQNINLRIREKDLNRKMPIKIKIMQCKSTEVIDQGYFIISADEIDLEHEPKIEELQLIKKSGWTNGVINIQLQSWQKKVKSSSKGIHSMDEKDEQYLQSSEQQKQQR